MMLTSIKSCLSSLWWSSVVGFAGRLGFMVYGFWQDSTMSVKFTDVDYYVFTDAAEFITKGESPYMRATYRYTPFLAWLLQPNIWLTSVFGKLLFIICDIVAGWLIYSIVHKRGSSTTTAVLCANAWLLNPLPMTVSSRGNADSIMATLVLATVYFLLTDRQGPRKSSVFFAAICYGLSVHTKIYPVCYALPLYLYLTSQVTRDQAWLPWMNRLLRTDVSPNSSRLSFVVWSVTVFAGLTGLGYWWYGMEFIQETYLYHITRRDTRHNFSPYFYMLYLLGDSEGSQGLGLAAFLPQLVLLIVISFKFSEDLPLSFFLQTFVFVSFNKVCTSQYFVWYLCLLPVLVPRLKMSGSRAVFLVLLWFLGQGAWLLPAYYLEFEGQNTFLSVWISGLVFLCCNVWICHTIIQTYSFNKITKRMD